MPGNPGAAGDARPRRLGEHRRQGAHRPAADGEGRERVRMKLRHLVPPSQLGGVRAAAAHASSRGMTMPDARAGRALLVESAGVDSDIDAECRRCGSRS